MLVKTIKYEDYNGMQREEDCYFNLSKAEIIEMELGVDGGLDEKIKRLTKSMNGPEIMKLFKEIILKAYGVKSDDGRRLIKSDRLSTEFSQTEAYSELLMELLSDPEAAAAFIKGIIPKVPNQAIPAPPEK